MRFRAPRSISPSPVRGSSFGLQTDYDDSSGSDSELNSEEWPSESDLTDTESVVSESSSGSSSHVSEIKVPQRPPRPNYSGRTDAELRIIDETVAAIRLRTRHYDPYEDWQRQTRVDAFRTARKELNVLQKLFRADRERSRKQEEEQRALIYTQQTKAVDEKTAAVQVQGKLREDHVKASTTARQTKMLDGIEGAIKAEEAKVRARLEEEERKREEEQQRKRKAEEEQRRKEEQEKKEAAEKAEKEMKEAEELRERSVKEREDKEKREGELKLRQVLGITTPEEDWKVADAHLRVTKTDTMYTVKADKGGKAEWGKWRRMITPRIGQLVDNDTEIRRISSEICDILQPPSGRPQHHAAIYKALLVSLAKIIIMQAEIEVTAKKESAMPLARVTLNLIMALPDFAEVFWFKLVQRTGGWAVPFLPPMQDVGPGPWTNEEERDRAKDRARRIAQGYRKSNTSDDLESNADYNQRVCAIMRVYFHVLELSRQTEVYEAFRTPRYWTWFARLLGDRQLIRMDLAPELISTALDVMGGTARKIWGHQWNKILELIYEGVTADNPPGKKYIGHVSAESAAGRARVQYEVEKALGV